MLTHLRQRFWSAKVSARRYGLSASTIHNRLRKKSHQYGPPLKGQTMTRRHRLDNDETSQLAYVQWARRHFIWQYVDWNRVSFSGETRFAINNAGGKTLSLDLRSHQNILLILMLSDRIVASNKKTK